MTGTDPSLSSYAVDLAAASGTLGHLYRFKIEAYNHAGATDSSALSVALASLPAAPPQVPTSDGTQTSATQLAIAIQPLTTAAENGGASILQYELQYDDGQRGPFTSVFTLSPLTVVSQGIQRGLEHRARYRARNFNGWGPWSAVAYIAAAGRPGKPAAPTLASATASEITLALSPTTDDGGAPVTDYEVHIDLIQTNPAFKLATL
jgi:hypothetical protein